MGIASLAFAGITSATQIAKIAAQKFGGTAGTPDTPQPQVSTGAMPRTPSFNMVGGSTGNQIAEIGKKPVKAFVVSGEVTTAQQLERNAVSEASI